MKKESFGLIKKITVQKMSFFCKIFSFVNVNHLEGRFWQLYINKFIKKNLHLLDSESSTS